MEVKIERKEIKDVLANINSAEDIKVLFKTLKYPDIYI